MGSTRVRTDVPPIDHALKASLLQVDRAQRAAQAALGAARLFSPGSYGSTFEALWGIGDAARGRLEHMQKGWVEDWFTWLKYARQIEGAGTVSKLAERELNIVNQAVQLVSEQTVGLLTLASNVEVDVLYLLAEPPRAPEATVEPPPPPPEQTAPHLAPLVEATVAPARLAAPETVVAPEVVAEPEAMVAPEITVAPEVTVAPDVIAAPEMVASLGTIAPERVAAASEIIPAEPTSAPQAVADAPPKPAPAPARTRPKPKGAG